MVKTVSLKDEKPWLMGLLHVEKVFLERKKKIEKCFRRIPVPCFRWHQWRIFALRKYGISAKMALTQNFFMR